MEGLCSYGETNQQTDIFLVRLPAYLTNKQDKQPLRAPGNHGPHLILVKHIWQMLQCVFEFCRASNVYSPFKMQSFFQVQCRELHWITEHREITKSHWQLLVIIEGALCTLSRLKSWLSQNGYTNIREESIVFRIMILFILMFQNDLLVCFS